MQFLPLSCQQDTTHHFLMWVPIEFLAIVFFLHPSGIISVSPPVLSPCNQQAWLVAPSRASKAVDDSDAYCKRPSRPDAPAVRLVLQPAMLARETWRSSFCSRSSLGYMLGCVAAKKGTKKLETYTPAKQWRSKQLSGIIISLVGWLPSWGCTDGETVGACVRRDAVISWRDRATFMGMPLLGRQAGRAAALVETRPVPHAQTRPMASWRCRQTAHAKEITQEHQHIESCFSHCWSRRRNHFYWETVYSFPFSLQTNLVPHQFFFIWQYSDTICSFRLTMSLGRFRSYMHVLPFSLFLAANKC